jgi:NitT/TauT family transport system ATP-binding protein
MTSDNFVEIADVRLQFGGSRGTLAVDRLNMSVSAGELTAVVGPSGCGKSSLMKLVAGLMPPSSGTIRVNSMPVTRPLKVVGMAFQNPTLLPWRTTLENLMLPLQIVRPYRSRFNADRPKHEANARRLLDRVGLCGFEDRFPWQLSGGMQQRASLCRALIHKPSLLMLDEPFGALDAFTREDLWDVLQTIWMEERFTAVLVTHDLREAVYLSDTVHVMSARPGKIVATYRVGLPRPRNPETPFLSEFTDLVHTMREQIRKERAVAAL